MLNVHFEGAREIGKPKNMTDEQCASAWAMPFVQEVDVPIDDQGNTMKQPVQCWLMAYQPSKEDREAIARGENIYLKIMAPQLTPHALWTMNPDTNEPNI